jgi:hypothetical protein
MVSSDYPLDDPHRRQAARPAVRCPLISRHMKSANPGLTTIRKTLAIADATSKFPHQCFPTISRARRNIAHLEPLHRRDSGSGFAVRNSRRCIWQVISSIAELGDR